MAVQHNLKNTGKAKAYPYIVEAKNLITAILKKEDCCDEYDFVCEVCTLYNKIVHSNVNLGTALLAVAVSGNWYSNFMMPATWICLENFKPVQRIVKSGKTLTLYEETVYNEWPYATTWKTEIRYRPNGITSIRESRYDECFVADEE